MVRIEKVEFWKNNERDLIKAHKTFMTVQRNMMEETDGNKLSIYKKKRIS